MIKNPLMKTKLLEFPNNENQNLRGIITLPNGEIKKSVICLHGFERCSTTEKKFKALSNSLTERMIAILRFDFSGCGLSDGNFTFSTINRQGNEFIKAVDKLTKETGSNKISIIAHSLGACVLANKIEEAKSQIEKIILIAPALNQKDLLRYWFVVSQMKKSNPDIEITWVNYRKYLDESAFIKDCQRDDKMAKANYIGAKYFLEGKDFDFSEKFKDTDLEILHIHGSNDITVPINSLNVKFENQVIVKNGDHDLEKPDIMELWKSKAVDFLSK